MFSTTFASAFGQLKNIRFWLAVVFGLATGLLFYQEIFAKLWPVESRRLIVSSNIFTITFIVSCFWLLEKYISVRFGQLAKSEQRSIMILSLVIPGILAIAVLNPQQLAGKYIYFLLPTHSIQIEVPVENAQKLENFVLTGFSTQAQGFLSLDMLNVEGWERRGNELILTNPANNLITWHGKTGWMASLFFRSRTDQVNISVSWDDDDFAYNLFSDTSEVVRISRKFQVPLYAGWPIYTIAAYLTVFFVTFALFVVLAVFPGFITTPIPSKRMWLVYALPMYIVWTIYLLVFWPGFMSPDSISQWGQLVTGELFHAHPVGHTLTMWLITRLWFSPAAVAVVQILSLGGVLGWGVATLREFNAPGWLAWLTITLLAVSPANAALSITIWKDVLFSTVVVALTILLFKIIATQGMWLNQKPAWLSLGIVLAFISLYRLNGFFVSFISLLIIALIYKKYWKILLKAACLFLMIYFLFTGPIFRWLNVRTVNLARDELVAIQLLAGHMHAGTILSSEDQAVLRPILAEYPWPYNCYRNSALIFNSTLDRKYMIEHSREILSIAWKATLQNPLVTLGHFACQGASVYRIPQEYPNEVGMFGIFENRYGLTSSSVIPALYSPLMNFLLNPSENWLDIGWLVWRMPFWMYLSGFGCILFCMRNKTWRPLIILVPGLLTVLPYLILTLGQIFRYVYSMYLIGILLSGYFWVSALPKKNLAAE